MCQCHDKKNDFSNLSTRHGWNVECQNLAEKIISRKRRKEKLFTVP